MKNTIIAFIAGLGLMAGLMAVAKHTRPAQLPEAQTTPDTAPSSNLDPARLSQSPAPSRRAQSVATAPAPDSNTSAVRQLAYTPPLPDPVANAKLAFKQSMDVLLTPQSTHEQRQAAWKQIMANGQLNDAIAQLQQLSAANPQSADYAGTLGEAYLKKCSLTDDVRQQAILAMNADQLFDTALNLNPSDWEARFTKAVAMSHWPASLNKGQDVVDNFLTLIQQQDSQPAQTQFALPYLKLGDYYQKAGDNSSAVHAWQQGATLFPANDDLKSRLASSN